MAKLRWNELDPRVRLGVVAAAAVEGCLKIVALRDLARRPAAEVRGPKPVWAAALSLVGSVGILPIVYLLRGRRTT